MEILKFDCTQTDLEVTKHYFTITSPLVKSRSVFCLSGVSVGTEIGRMCIMCVGNCILKFNKNTNTVSTIYKYAKRKEG